MVLKMWHPFFDTMDGFSSNTTTLVKLPILLLNWTKVALKAIGNMIGKFVALDDGFQDMSKHSISCILVELDNDKVYMN